MIYTFIEYKTETNGEVYFGLEKDGVSKVIDGETFIEVTTSLDKVTPETVHMIKRSSLTKVGKVQVDVN